MIDDEKLETIKLLSQYNSEEITQIMIIMTFWDDMVKEGILTDEDINSISSLSEEKQQRIKDYVSKQLMNQQKGTENGTKKS